MANTKTSTKRAKQAKKRQSRNQSVRSATRTLVKSSLEALKKGDVQVAQTAFIKAVKGLSKAATKGAIPKRRAARKISRLTRLTKKTLPAALGSKS